MPGMSLGLGLGLSAGQVGRAILALDFVSSTSLDSRITFTRASSGTYVNSAGLVATANTNIPRFDYSPTSIGAPLGLLIEEQRTNNIRNNTMVGAVPGVAGAGGNPGTNWFIGGFSGCTVTIIGTGTENGIDYIDIRFQGTPSGTFGTVFPESATTLIAATNGQTWASSLYLKRTAGSNTNFSLLYNHNQRDSGGASLGDVTAIASVVPSTTLTRLSGAVANSNASTAYIRPFLAFVLTIGQAIDVTLRFGLPQLELGAFVTSVIKTTSAAVTRAADSPVMTGSNFSSWYNQAQGTFVAEADQFYAVSNATLIDASDGTTNNENFLFGGAAVTQLIRTGGVTQSNLFGGTIVANTVYKTASAYGNNDAQLYANGTNLGQDISVSLPTVDRAYLGSRNSTSFWLNGHLRRLSYYNTRLPNTALQALTA
jgi:hypothetical protein